MFPVRWARWILIQHKWSEGFQNLGGIVASVVMVRNPSKRGWVRNGNGLEQKLPWDVADKTLSSLTPPDPKRQ